MRDAALACLREIGVDTGGSNVQFAIDPATGRMVIVEMNPRVSRSSALASKATGFPIAKIAAKLAVGYRLRRNQERHHAQDAGVLRADHRLRGRQNSALAVRKIPRRGAGAGHADEERRRSDGHRPHVQTGAGQRACGASKPARPTARRSIVDELIEPRLITPNPDRLGYIRYAFERGYTEEQVHALTSIDPWFLRQVREMVDLEQQMASLTLETITREQIP